MFFNHRKFYIYLFILILIFLFYFIYFFSIQKETSIKFFDEDISNIINDSSQTTVKNDSFYYKIKDGKLVRSGSFYKGISLTLEEDLRFKKQDNKKYLKIKNTNYYIDYKDLNYGYIELSQDNSFMFEKIDKLVLKNDIKIYKNDLKQLLGYVNKNNNIDIIGFDEKTKVVYIDFFDYIGLVKFADLKVNSFDFLKDKVSKINNNINTINYRKIDFTNLEESNNSTNNCSYDLKIALLIKKNYLESMCDSLNINYLIIDSKESFNKLVKIIENNNYFLYKLIIISNKNYYNKVNLLLKDNLYLKNYALDIDKKNETYFSTKECEKDNCILI